MTLKTIKDAAAQRRAKISSKDSQEMDLGIHSEQGRSFSDSLFHCLYFFFLIYDSHSTGSRIFLTKT